LVHYWSLSIEEQFYVMWPLLLLAVGLVARRRPVLFRPTLGVALALVGIGSLLASAILTPGGANAYYWTHVRIWELATGAGLALARPLLHRIAPRAAGVLGATGMVLIVLAAMSFGQDTIFPGAAALLPVAGSAMVLIAGFAPRARVPRILAGGPLPAIGRISYGWYLWHWPAIGIAVLLTGRRLEDDTMMAAWWAIVLAVIASLLLAMASHRLVEQPVRRSQRLAAAPRLSVASGILLTLLPVGMTLARDPEPQLSPPDPAVAESEVPVRLVMTPAEARDDGVRGMRSCHIGFGRDDLDRPCAFGDPQGDRTIALIGDSHAQHWFPVLDRVARARGWKLLAWTKSACAIVDVPIYNYRAFRPYEECSSWRHRLFDRLRAEPGMIDLVVIGRSRGYAGIVLNDDGERIDREAVAPFWEAGARRTYAALLEASRAVVQLEDTPWGPRDVPACLSEHLDDPRACEFPAERFVNRDAVLVAAERAGAPEGVQFVDFSREICPSQLCPVVTDEGLIIYRDAHHMTMSFNLTLAPLVRRTFAPLVERG